MIAPKQTLGYNDSSNSQTFRKMKNIIIKTSIVFISLLFGFLLLEFGGRLYSRSVDLFHFENFVSRQLDLFESLYPSAYNSNLGYIPKPGTAGVSNPWATFVTILEHGIRSNGGNEEVHNARDAIILAVGDSFTFGDNVSDHETWPAYLDTLVKEKVINGGVFGYGLDQTVLRAEELASIFTVQILVVSFIPADINRTQFSMRTGVSKPYFVMDDGQLVRKNRPVPQVRPVKDRIGLLRSILGYSYLMKWTTDRLGLTEWWLVGQWESQKVHSQGMQVSCLLTKRLRTLAVKTDARIVIVAQYGRGIVFDDQESSEDRVRVRDLLGCAKSNDLEILDLYHPLLRIYQSDLDLYNSYYEGHMTAAGNRFVAEQIANYLGRH